MAFRTVVASLAVLSALAAGCKEGKKQSEPAPGEATPAAPPVDVPPPPPGSGAPAAAADTPPAGGAEADPAKVEEAANTALKIMAVVSSAARGAKGDCARMKQNLSGVMTVAQKWRDQLAEQYKEPGVRQGLKEALAFGKFPELRMNLMETRDKSRACPDAAPDFEAVLAEIH